MWLRIMKIQKKLYAEVVVYSLDGHPLGIKEKIQIRIGKKLKENEQGIDELIKFLDEIYLIDDMLETWIKYKLFQMVKKEK